MIDSYRGGIGNDFTTDVLINYNPNLLTNPKLTQNLIFPDNFQHQFNSGIYFFNNNNNHNDAYNKVSFQIQLVLLWLGVIAVCDPCQKLKIMLWNDSVVQPELSGGIQPEDRTPAICVEGRRLNHYATKPDDDTIITVTMMINDDDDDDQWWSMVMIIIQW